MVAVKATYRTRSESTVRYREVMGLGAKLFIEQRLRCGKIIENKGFLSTSQDQSTARKFIAAFDHQLLVKIKCKSSALGV